MHLKMHHKCLKALVILITIVAIVCILAHLKEICELPNKDNSTVYYVKGPHCGSFSDIHYLCHSIDSVNKTMNVATEPTSNESTLNESTPTETPTTAITTTMTSKIRSSAEKSDADVEAGMAILKASDCGYSTDDRVSYGHDAKLGKYNFMALLVYTNGLSRTFECGGSLITDRYVLTAAHCIERRLVSVRLGEFNTHEDPDCQGRSIRKWCAPPMQEIDIEEAIYHEGHNSASGIDDIGIIRLIRTPIFESTVQPICLPITTILDKANIPQMLIAGWGKIETGLRSSILQTALVPLRSIDDCQEVHKVLRLTDKHLCAGGGKTKTSTCAGDSGSPMFYATSYAFDGGIFARYVQYGIATYGSFQCGTIYPSVYTRVASYIQWIAGNLRP